VTPIIFASHADKNQPTEVDAKSESTDIEEPFSPSSKELGFGFNKNATAAVSALVPSPPEQMSPTKEQALKDELSPVTEVPNDIRKFRFNIGPSPSDFIPEESEPSEDMPLHSSSTTSLTDSLRLFKPISEQTEVEEKQLDSIEICIPDKKGNEEAVDTTAHLVQEKESQSSANESSDEETDIQTRVPGLMSFENIAYEENFAPAEKQHVSHLHQSVIAEESSTEQENDDNETPELAVVSESTRKLSVSSDSGSEKRVDLEMEMSDIQDALQATAVNQQLNLMDDILTDHDEKINSFTESHRFGSGQAFSDNAAVLDSYDQHESDRNENACNQDEIDEVKQGDLTQIGNLSSISQPTDINKLL
jgi:hypothetical protein